MRFFDGKFVKEGSIGQLLDRLTFLHIFLVWVAIIVTFGLAYYFLAGSGNYLSFTAVTQHQPTIFETLYFSFITATTTGFGDIIPIGTLFRIIVIMEVISGLLLLAVVTSKLVSIRQGIILSEIYEISFNERLNRLRSSLLVFRQNLNRLVLKAEEGTVRDGDLYDFFTYLVSFEDHLRDITDLFSDSNENNLKKSVDEVGAELIFNSIVRALERLNETILLLNKEKKGWKKELVSDRIKRCLDLSGIICSKLQASKKIDPKTVEKLLKEKAIIVGAIEKAV
ncbi:MAG: potassium channel family protein [Candidatus Diapherotrites archaeon]|nr:potassium channel family protein [Candidatus Diapherotrites archaeon]